MTFFNHIFWKSSKKDKLYYNIQISKCFFTSFLAQFYGIYKSFKERNSFIPKESVLVHITVGIIVSLKSKQKKYNEYDICILILKISKILPGIIARKLSTYILTCYANTQHDMIFHWQLCSDLCTHAHFMLPNDTYKSILWWSNLCLQVCFLFVTMAK